MSDNGPLERPARGDVDGATSTDNPLSGLVPSGWDPLRFADRLEQMADGCQDLNPDTATEHRRKDVAIRAALGGATA